VGSPVLPLLPDLPGPGEARRQLFQAATTWLLSLAAQGGLVLIFDDLQWADATSLQLLQFLTGQLPVAPLLVVATYRDGEIDATHPLARALGSFARQPAVERIALAGLGEADVGHYIASFSGLEPSAALVRAVRQRTDGNPFFLTELVRALDREGALATGDVEAATSSPVPAGVRDVARQRLAALPEATRTLLAAAAMIGRRFNPVALQAVTDLDGETVLERLEPALMAGVVVERTGNDSGYEWAHGFVRETLHGDLTPIQRVRLQAPVVGVLGHPSLPHRANGPEMNVLAMWCRE
jgi:predicted ATPase